MDIILGKGWSTSNGVIMNSVTSTLREYGDRFFNDQDMLDDLKEKFEDTICQIDLGKLGLGEKIKTAKDKVVGVYDDFTGEEEE